MLLKKKLNSNDIALGGVLVALNIIILSLVSIIPTLKVALLFLTAVITVIATLKSNIKASLFVYIASTILASFIVVDKKYVIYYCFMFGLYPIIKYYLENQNNIWIEYLFKLIYFNSSFVISYYTIKTLFGFQISGQYSKIGLLIILQIGYLIFDYILSRVITNLLKYPIWKK